MLGAYGYPLVGDLRGAERWLQAVRDGQEPLHLVVRDGEPTAPPSWAPDACLLRTVTGGWVEGHRDTRSFVLWEGASRLGPDELAHPRLGVACAVAAAWDGLPALHAGAAAQDDRALLLLGDRGAGKSSTLAHLHRRGWDVVADDLSVVRGGRVQAGPRCLDSRTPTGDLVVRDGARWRVPLPPVPQTSPVVAVVVLAWGDVHEIRPVPLVERPSSWARHRTLGMSAAAPAQAFEVLSASWWRLTRPQRLDQLDATEELLRSVLR